MDVALGVSDRELILSAAALCGNPGVDHSVRARVSEAVGDDRVARIHFDDSVVPDSPDEKLLYWQCWPGLRPGRESPLAPVVVLDTSLDAAATLRLAARLADAGASARRLVLGPALPNWFGPQTVVVCGAPMRLGIRGEFPDFPLSNFVVAPRIETDQDQARLLRQLNAELPSGSGLRLDVLAEELPTNLWNPEVFGLGVYETREAAFLTSASTNMFYRLAKAELLRPRHFGRVAIWGFRDLVAVRTWRFFQTQSARRVSRRVVPTLANFAGDRDATSIGVTTDGRVLAQRGHRWVDIENDQQILEGLEIADIDESFQSFEIGGRHVPGLLQTSENTRLNPAVLHGAPHLKGHRITARALAQLDERHGRAAIRSAYPEIGEAPIADTISIGRQLLYA